MAAANTILRLIGATLSLIVIPFVAAVGYALFDPVYNNVIDPKEMEALGWGAPQDTIMLFAALAFIGLSMTVIIWWMVGRIRSDVRQETAPPF